MLIPKTRLALLCAWETWFPATGPFPVSISLLAINPGVWRFKKCTIRRWDDLCTLVLSGISVQNRKYTAAAIRFTSKAPPESRGFLPNLCEAGAFRGSNCRENAYPLSSAHIHRIGWLDSCCARRRIEGGAHAQEKRHHAHENNVGGAYRHGIGVNQERV